MKPIDGRKLSSEAMADIRIKAVQRVQEGESPEQVIRTLGFARACIYNWLDRYRNGGWHALRVGPPSGRPKKLNESQIIWLYKTIRDKDPDSLNLNSPCGHVP